MTKPEVIYWDSDCFLGWFQEEVDKVDLCHATIQRAENNEILLVTSALTIAEVLWMRGAPRIVQEKAEIVRSFFRRRYIRVRNVTRHIAESAQDLVWIHDIRPKDAIHVATALDAGLHAMETFDEQLLKKSGLVGDNTLMIRRPLGSDQGKLL